MVDDPRLPRCPGPDPASVTAAGPASVAASGHASEPEARPRVGGRIVLVGTPIGNLGDLSPRAARALGEADVLCCEDTRHTRKLLSAAGIAAPRLVPLHEHNEESAASYVLGLAAEGRTVAVVSDAGMPGISDPGERLVRAAAAAGVPVEVVPGPSAVISALVLSGLASDRFCFEGFLPRKGSERRERLAVAAAETRTTVLYEAPHRVARTLQDLRDVCGDQRPVALVRELTKRFEEVWRGTLGAAVIRSEGSEPRGEWVLVLGGAAPVEVDDVAVVAALADRRAEGAERRTAIDDVSALLGVARNRVYRLALAADHRATPTDPDPAGRARKAPGGPLPPR